MILKNVERNDNFVIFEYIATWQYGFDFMLDVTQLIINSDFKHNVTRFAYAPLGTDLKDRLLDLKTFQYNVKRCFREESNTIAIAGNSSIMELPLQIMLFNNTDIVKLYIPKSYDHDIDDHMFDKYMDSMEIKAYCISYKRGNV